MSKSVSLSILLIVMVCLSIHFMLRNVPRCHSTLKQQLDNQPDVFMHNVSYFQYDYQGLLHSHLKTRLIVHYPLEDSSYFNHPYYLIYTDKRVPWTVVANQGKSQGGVHRVYFWDHVKIHESQQPTEPETTIATRTLTIFPNHFFAKTDKDVIITRPNSTIQAAGMAADLKKGIVHLLSHSIGIIYETDQPQKQQKKVKQNNKAHILNLNPTGCLRI